MRTMWAAAIATAALACAGTAARADDREAAVAVVEQGIKAQGGEYALNRARTLSRTGAGTITIGGGAPAFTEETIWALPDRLRMSVDVEKGVRITLVVNGDKGWRVSGGAVLELGKEGMEEVREDAYVLWLATLTPLLKDTYTLTPLPDGSVDGLPAAGVKVTAKGHFDAKLYFDKGTHLLVKIQRRARESGVALTKTYLFSDYKDVDGVKLPIREVQLLNDKKFMERTSATYKILDRVDDTTFAKP